LKNKQIIDVGTGAGLPGIPISLCLKDSESQIYLCESKQKKVDFLLKCKEKLKLTNVEVIPSRVESIKNKKFDYIIGRAVTQLNSFFSMSYNIKKENTIFLLHKGIHIDKEIEDATKCWDFLHYLHGNDIEKGSFIIEVKNLIKSIS
jgi:16S rRNA (guanine527-N7)-methyltransferase